MSVRLFICLLTIMYAGFARSQTKSQFDAIADKINYATAAFLIGEDSAAKVLGDSYAYSKFSIKLSAYYTSAQNKNIIIANELNQKSLQIQSSWNGTNFNDNVDSMIDQALESFSKHTTRNASEKKALESKLVALKDEEYQKFGIPIEAYSGSGEDAGTNGQQIGETGSGETGPADTEEDTGEGDDDEGDEDEPGSTDQNPNVQGTSDTGSTNQLAAEIEEIKKAIDKMNALLYLALALAGVSFLIAVYLLFKNLTRKKGNYDTEDLAEIVKEQLQTLTEKRLEDEKKIYDKIDAIKRKVLSQEDIEALIEAGRGTTDPPTAYGERPEENDHDNSRSEPDPTTTSHTPPPSSSEVYYFTAPHSTGFFFDQTKLDEVVGGTRPTLYELQVTAEKNTFQPIPKSKKPDIFQVLLKDRKEKLEPVCDIRGKGTTIYRIQPGEVILKGDKWVVLQKCEIFLK